MPAGSRANTAAKKQVTWSIPLFTGICTCKGFSVGQQPQTPVPFTSGLNIHFPSCNANAWNLLLNKHTVYQSHFYKLAMHIQLKKDIPILQRQTITYLLQDARSLFSMPICWCPYLRFLFAVLS